MNKKSLSEIMIAFFVCTASICIMQGVIGSIFMPEARFGYGAFLSPPLFGLCSVIFGVITSSKNELSMKKIIFRRILHLFLIESLVFGLNYLVGYRLSIKLNIILAVAISVVFIVVYIVLYINDRRSAIKFNEKLKQYQDKVKKEKTGKENF